MNNNRNYNPRGNNTNNRNGRNNGNRSGNGGSFQNGSYGNNGVNRSSGYNRNAGYNRTAGNNRDGRNGQSGRYNANGAYMSERNGYSNQYGQNGGQYNGNRQPKYVQSGQIAENKSRKILIFLVAFAVVLTIIILIISPKKLKADDTEITLEAETTESVTEAETTAETTAETEAPLEIDGFLPASTQAKVAYAARTDSTVNLGSEVESEYAILIDLTSNTVIAEKNGDSKMYPASMTKVMTILLAAEKCRNLDDTFTMTLDITDPLFEAGASCVGFSAGEKPTILDMIYGAALPSGADATNGLAEYIAGSESEFAKLMNEKCTELGLKGTHFVTASGLHDNDHYSTCHDIAIIFEAAMRNPIAKTVLSTGEYTTSKTPEHPDGITITSTLFDRIFGSKEFEEKITITAGKTGYTGEAGSCLVTTATVAGTGKEYVFVCGKANGKWNAIYDTIHVYRKYLGIEYDGEYVPGSAK